MNYELWMKISVECRCDSGTRPATEVRLAVEKHIRNTYLKQVRAPVGVNPVLKCWMELN